MRYLFCDCEDQEIILLALRQRKYTCSGQSPFLFKNFKILIDKELKTYYILINKEEAELVAKGHTVFHFNSEDSILKQLGIDYSFEELTKNIEDKLFQLLGIKNEDKAPKTEEEKFKEALVPGRIVELDNGYLGFIVTPEVIMYSNRQGQIKGYLTNFTVDFPYEIKRILIPTSEYYQLKDYNKMKAAWTHKQKPVTVKKSISEIEKALGIKPGTLEIY